MRITSTAITRHAVAVLVASVGGLEPVFKPATEGYLALLIMAMSTFGAAAATSAPWTAAVAALAIPSIVGLAQADSRSAEGPGIIGSLILILLVALIIFAAAFIGDLAARTLRRRI